jgi:hypothetical protein
MKLRVRQIPEPSLLFGNGFTHVDPRIGLEKGGLLSVNDTVRSIKLGLVCLETETSQITKWIKRLDGWMIDTADNVLRFPKFPGSARAVHAKFELNETKHVREIGFEQFQSALSHAPQERFGSLLDLFAARIQSLFQDAGPSCILVGFPEEVAMLRVANSKLSFHEQRLLQRLQEESDSHQMELFDSFTDDEKRAAKELLPQADELLFRNFHRALKARCMNLHGATPLQIIRRHTYEENSAKQNDATKAWNISVALAYKAGEIPWQPTTLTAGTCFVGISFHHLKRRSGDIVYASLAQAYSTNSEPYAIQGEPVPRDQTINKRPYLKAKQADAIIQKVIARYNDQTGDDPSRIVIHKSSLFVPPEIEGFRECLNQQVAQIDLISLHPAGLRLLTKGEKEVSRGSLVDIEGERTFFFTSGYVDWWKSYPGPHIPAPIELRGAGEEDLHQCAGDILALTKMNWNSAEGLGRTPITLSFARQVGVTMTELKEDDAVNPFFRFYM